MVTRLRTSHARAIAALAAVWWSHGGAAYAAETTRVALLPAGVRASVLVELNADVPNATAVEAADDRTVAVEIGPVREAVLNQLLQAANDSPLVDRVRLRATPHGEQGTLITIQVMAKQPVTGSVRRSSRRVYIDLAPRDGERAPVAAGGNLATPRPSARPSALPTPAASPSLTTPGALPRATSAATRPATSAAPAVATRTVSSPLDIEAAASQLAAAADVRGLERLKRDLEAKRSAPDAAAVDAVAIDAALSRLDAFVLEAQRNRLKADAALLRGGPSAPAPSTPASGSGPAAPSGAATPSTTSEARSIEALRAFRPDLEKIAQAAAAWTGGQPPPTLVTLSAMLPRFRAQRPPASIAKAHADASAALDQLALVWASASANPPPEGQPPASVQRVHAVLDSYLTLERALDAKP